MTERIAIDFLPDKGVSGGGEQNATPWWEGKGKVWKDQVVDILSEVKSGEELIGLYPELGREQLLDLKHRFLIRGSPDQRTLDLIVGAIGYLVRSGLDSSQRDDSSLGGNHGVVSAVKNKVTGFHLR